MSEEKTFTELLRKRNLRATSQRIDVLNVIDGHDKAIPSSTLRETLPSLDRVTLYRTINTLLESGIIHKAMVDDQETYFALCSTGCSSHAHVHDHVHFKCDECAEVTCVEADNFPPIGIPGYQIANIKIEVSGLCKNCLA
jgi:Fur family ferric uptake transcriptional regulator